MIGYLTTLLVLAQPAVMSHPAHKPAHVAKAPVAHAAGTAPRSAPAKAGTATGAKAAKGAAGAHHKAGAAATTASKGAAKAGAAKGAKGAKGAQGKAGAAKGAKGAKGAQGKAGAAKGKKGKLALPKYKLTDAKPQNFWVAQEASAAAPAVDWLYYSLIGLTAFFFFGIAGTVILFVIKYRHRPGNLRAQPSTDHNDALEVTWTVIPSIIVVIIFILGWKGYMYLQAPPKHALEIDVTAHKWAWEFTYPNGDTEAILHVPVDKPVRMVMKSQDVIHSFYVPAFRIKQDVLPDRYTSIWFKATRPGVYRLTCAEYCGKGHSLMKTKVVVHRPGGYAKWLAKVQEANENMPPVELGKHVYETRGCKQCHSLNGSPGTGPSWKGIFGTKVKLSDGTSVLVDETYIRRSVLDPAAQVVAGYNPVMPTFKGKLNDRDINGVIAFIKSLTKK